MVLPKSGPGFLLILRMQATSSHTVRSGSMAPNARIPAERPALCRDKCMRPTTDRSTDRLLREGPQQKLSMGGFFHKEPRILSNNEVKDHIGYNEDRESYSYRIPI